MITVVSTGISVILCCHNSERRLPKTIQHLCRQQVPSWIPWELILVDNASTDHTRETAVSTWKKEGGQVPMRILYEPIAGLMNARQKGIQSARYSYLLFCDDDNWLNPCYLQSVFRIMESDTRIAACGGKGTAVFETGREPEWFSAFQEAYAVGPQRPDDEKGDTDTLYGAGMTIRKSALNHLESCGFKNWFMGRKAEKLSSSDDTELTNAMRIAGYRLVYDPQMIFQHFLTENRLNTQYLLKLFQAFGTDGPVRNIYCAYLSKHWYHKLCTNWYFHMALTMTRTVKYLIKPPKKNARSLYLEWNQAYAAELLRIRKEYPRIIQNIGCIRASKTFDQREIIRTSPQSVTLSQA